MYDQLYEYIVHFLNQLLCGILMGLSKAYDCLPHDLLTAKLEAHGLDNGSLKLLLDYH